MVELTPVLAKSGKGERAQQSVELAFDDCDHLQLDGDRGRKRPDLYRRAAWSCLAKVFGVDPIEGVTFYVVWCFGGLRTMRRWIRTKITNPSLFIF